MVQIQLHRCVERHGTTQRSVSAFSRQMPTRLTARFEGDYRTVPFTRQRRDSIAICGRKLGEPRRRISIISRSTSRTATRRLGEDDQPGRSVSGVADPRAGSKSENSTYFRRDGAPAYAPPRSLNSPVGSTESSRHGHYRAGGPGCNGPRGATVRPAGSGAR